MRRGFVGLIVGLLLAAPAAAQDQNAAFKIVTLTDTTARALMVGCTVGSVSQCTGGINAGPIAVEAITGTGLLSITKFSADHLLTGTGDGPMRLSVTNPSTGTGAIAAVRLAGSVGEVNLKMFGGNYAGSGKTPPDSALLESSGANGISFSASDSNASLRFYESDHLLGTMSYNDATSKPQFSWDGDLDVSQDVDIADDLSAQTVSMEVLRVGLSGFPTTFDIDVAGNVDGDGTMDIDGATTLRSTLSVTGNVTVNTDKFTVAASSGNTAVAGTLAVTGTTTQAAVNASGLYTLTRGATSTPGLGGWAYVNTGATAGGSFRVDGGSDFNIDMYTGAAWANVAQFTDNGNFKLGGTATRAGTAGTAHLDIFNGTNPSGTLTNGVSLYSNAGELTAMDAAGNATPLSSHDDETNLITLQSKNTVTGKVVRIELEELLRALDAHLGGGYITDFVDQDVARPLPNVRPSRFAQLGWQLLAGGIW